MKKYKSKVVSMLLIFMMLITSVQPVFANLERVENPGPNRAVLYVDYLDKFNTEANLDYLWDNSVKGTVPANGYINVDRSDSLKILGFNVGESMATDEAGGDTKKKMIMNERPKQGYAKAWAIIDYMPGGKGATIHSVEMLSRQLAYKAMGENGPMKKPNDTDLNKYDVNRLILTDISYMTTELDDPQGRNPKMAISLNQSEIAYKIREVNNTFISLDAILNRPLEKLVFITEIKGKVTLKDGEKYIAQNGTEIDITTANDGELLRRVGSYKDENGATVQNPAETFILPNMTGEGFLGWRVKEIQDTNSGVKKVSTGEVKDIEEGNFTLGEETDVDRLFKEGTTIKIKNDVEFEAVYKDSITLEANKIVKDASGKTLKANDIVKTEDILTYEVKVKALKDSYAKIEDNIPAGTEFVADSATLSNGATVTETAGKLSTEDIKLNADDELTLIFKVKVTAEEGKINNTAQVTPSKIDGDNPGEKGQVIEAKAPELLVVAKDVQSIIKKVDSETGAPLAGAKFKLYKVSGDGTGKGIVKDKAALEAEKLELETEKAKLEAKKAELAKEETDLETELAKEENAKKVKEIEEKIEKAKEEIKAIESKIEAVEAKLAVTEDKIEEKQEELEDAIKEIKEQIEEKQEILEKAKSTLSEEEKAKLEEEKATLEEEKIELEKQIVEHEKELKELKEKIEGSKGPKEENKEEIEKIETRLSEINARLEAIEKEMKNETDTSVLDANATGEVVAEYTTDVNGLAVIKKLADIDTVKYVIKEIQAPSGYVLDGATEYQVPKELNQEILIKNKKIKEEKTYRVRYDGNGNTSGSAPTDSNNPYKEGSSVKVLGNGELRRTKYSFKGWSTSASASRIEYRSGDTFTITKDTTLYAVWDKDSDGGKTDPVKPIKPIDPPEEKTKDPKGREYGTVIEPKVEYELNKKDHYAYIKGYKDNTVQPGGYITREEVAMVFYRLMEPEYRSEIETATAKYGDVKEGRWSAKAIATLSKGEILKGYTDGTFKPSNNMTRAEVAKAIARFTDVKVLETEFPDIIGHWAEDYINTAGKEGWIKGYKDGSFRPDELLTRAEFVTMMNSLLDRQVKKENALSGLKQFKDLPNEWYYEQMIEAINGHNYDSNRLPDGSEKWTELVNTQFPD